MDEAFLTDLLECSVCLEQLDSTSKVLPCQHTFCKRCLDEIVHSHKELRCPECRILVEARVEDLPLNILLVRLLEGIKNNPRLGSRCPPGNVSMLGSTLIGREARPSPQAPPPSSNQPSSAGPVSRGGEVTLGVRTLVKQLVPQMPCAKALYAYDAKDPGDLSFRKGDLIVLHKRVDQHWLHGELQGKQGFVPASYVQVVVPLPSHLPQCKALYDFRMADSDEKDCLAFLKGDVITVIRRVDENWAEGKLGERIGIFPISFVEMNVAGKALMKLSNNVQVGPSRIAPPTPNSEAPNQPVISASGAPSAGESQSSTTSPASSSPSPGTPPSSSPPAPASQLAGREKRHSLSALGSSSCGGGRSPPAPHRHSMEVLSSGSEPEPHGANGNPQGSASSPSRIPTPSAKVPVEVPGRVVRRHSGRREREHASSAGHSATEQCSALLVAGTTQQPQQQPQQQQQQQQQQQPTPQAAISSFYVALYNYKPQKEDELELRKNELYSVTEKCQDGWFKGTSLRTGLSGVFPGNYVQPAKSNATGFHVGLVGLQQQQPATRIPAPTSPRPRCGMVAQPVVAPVPFPTVAVGQQQGQAPPLGEWALATPSPQRMPPSTTPSPMGHKPPMQQLGVAKAVPVTTSTAGPPGPHVPSQRGGAGPWLLAWPPQGGPYGGHAPWVPSSACAATPTRSPPRQATPPTAATPSSGAAPPGGGVTVAGSQGGVSPGCSSSTPTALPSSAAMLHMEKKERREKDKMSLMKRLTSKRRSRSPPPPNFSCDNPSFVDSSSAAGSGPSQQPSNAAAATMPVVHIRSGSCPSEALGTQQALHKKTSSLDGSDSLKTRPKQPAPLVRERFRCIVPYPPNSEYELELKQGDVVYVHKKREDGWFKGTLQRTGKTGLFPGSFVQGF
ncbi:E3 ubiquitin-protein ligase SH3RF3 isoform X2 [Ixodes scapularis]|uniref:E3 ubiquitin-protein ligase SH3RF3 isoform X2 n=1 Tax=Ixodes scapularis TaxID=6945 RepID=UPI001A9F481A|nr:E3 ubiquitin-protein ligase SH3RF3 isoform X2 [Ixodes scapularis]